ncbi:PEBP-like protein [Viridothelium virens]|uniref:PEBP-like protein n=1 Tax=Viridothelium virens TaxID=1048519 RepID=A0A6A6HC79_VIRVR|nr:PEBP-like protein [Viridothelium virens]
MVRALCPLPSLVSLISHPANLYPAVPKLQPQIGLESLPAGTTSSSLFTIIMIDPDAPTPQDTSESQIIHWLQPSAKASTSSSSTSLTPITFTATAAAQAAYIPPAPPQNSSAHRYIQYLFSQPSGFTVPAEFTGFGGNNRTNFDIASFVQASGLKGPLAANYVRVAQPGAPGAASSSSFGGSASGNGSSSQGNSTGKPQPFTGGAAGGMSVSGWGLAALLGGLFVAYGF